MWNQVHGTPNNDVIDWLQGVTGDEDAIFGFDGDDQIFAQGGDDYIYGGYGADHIDGGYGSDTSRYYASGSAVIVSLATGVAQGGMAEGDTFVSIENLSGSNHGDTLVGDNNVNVLDGDMGDDILKGGGGADALYGGFPDDFCLGGNDTLKGGGGADFLDGGDGIDTAAYNESSARVSVALWSGIAHYGDAEGDTFLSIENLTGSAHNDALVGDDGVNVLRGLDGHDDLKGAGGADTLWGGNGNDALFGHEGTDTLRGEAGNDGLDGGAGIDTMIGGLGNDIYYVDNPNDVVTEYAGQGSDVVRASVSYWLAPGADVETLETTNANGVAAIHLTGNNSGNQIIGNNGANIIDGRGGVDQMTGRGGSDTYYVDHANDSVSENGGQGSDTVYTGVSWTITANADVEMLRTTDENGTASLILTGNSTGNAIRGNAGVNFINGGGGNDQLFGLGGQDYFVFTTTLDAATNVDIIADFNVADDTILLENTIFGAFSAGDLAAERFVVGAAAQDASDCIIYNSNTGALLYDSDGNGAAAAVQFAQLTAGLGLTHLDFYVV